MYLSLSGRLSLCARNHKTNDEDAIQAANEEKKKKITLLLPCDEFDSVSVRSIILSPSKICTTIA